MSKVLVISTSLRVGSNSDILAGSLIAGAKEAGHEVELISLKGKEAIVNHLWIKGLITDTEREEICRILSENLQKAA